MKKVKENFTNIETIRIEIRSLKIEDLPTRVEWMNDSRIYASMHFNIPVLLDKTIQWYNNNLNNDCRIDLVFYDLENPKSILGFAGIVSIDHTVNKAETYLFVNPNLIGKGIGSKAKRLLINYAFKQLGLNKLYVITNEDNYASICIQEKFGYKLEGRLRQEYKTYSGELKDRLYFGLLKSDWDI